MVAVKIQMSRPNNYLFLWHVTMNLNGLAFRMLATKCKVFAFPQNEGIGEGGVEL